MNRTESGLTETSWRFQQKQRYIKNFIKGLWIRFLNVCRIFHQVSNFRIFNPFGDDLQSIRLHRAGGHCSSGRSLRPHYGAAVRLQTGAVPEWSRSETAAGFSLSWERLGSDRILQNKTPTCSFIQRFLCGSWFSEGGALFTKWLKQEKNVFQNWSK